jgi:hypothetical protein
MGKMITIGFGTLEEVLNWMKERPENREAHCGDYQLFRYDKRDYLAHIWEDYKDKTIYIDDNFLISAYVGLSKMVTIEELPNNITWIGIVGIRE